MHWNCKFLCDQCDKFYWYTLLALDWLWNNSLERYKLSTNLGIDKLGMTHLSLSSCSYMSWYLQRVKLLLAWWRWQHCADCDNDRRDWYVTLKTKISSSHILYALIPSFHQKHKQNYLSWSSATMSSTTFSNHFMGGCG